MMQMKRMTTVMTMTLMKHDECGDDDDDDEQGEMAMMIGMTIFTATVRMMTMIMITMMCAGSTRVRSYGAGLVL